MRRVRVRVAILLTVALLANGLVVLPSAPAVSGTGLWDRLSRIVAGLAGPQKADAAAAQQGRVEVPELRTRYSRTYTTPEGFLEAAVSAGPVNFQDAGGAWQPIDDTLVATTVPGYAWENKADRYRVLLPSNLNGAPIRIERGSAWISFKIAGASAQGVVSGNTVTYANAFPGVTISFSAVGDEVKESIVLANAGVPASYSFDVRTSPGLSFKANGGGLDVYAGSSFQFSLPAPYMSDASISAAGFSRAVSFQTTPTANGLSLTVAVDPAWLASPERVWPILIDPTVTLTGPAVNADCHIVGGSFANTKFCGSTELEVGSHSTGHRHGLLYFPVESALPRDSQIMAAKLSLYVPRAATNGSLTVGLRELRNPFTSDATWTKRNATTNWDIAGGDYASTTLDSQSAGAAAGWVDFNAADVTQRWVNGETRNDGFLLRRQIEDTTDQLVRFVSRNGTNSAQWPTLTIVYDARLGRRDAYTYDTKSLSDRSELDVNVGNGNLLVGATDFNIRGMGMDLVVNRTYNGLADPARIGQVGRGWNLSVGTDVRLTAFASGPVVLSGPSGELIPFLPDLSNPNGYKVPPGTNATLTKSLNGSTYTYILTWRKSGEEWTFTRTTAETTAKLINQQDRNVNRLRYIYDASNRLTQVEQLRRAQTAGTGRTVTASYVGTSTLIDKLTDSTGRVVDYNYTGNDLTSVTDADNKTVSYTYTGDTLTKITDARNNPINLGYEAGGTRRVASITRVTASTSDTDPTTSYSYGAYSSQTCGSRTTLFATTNLTDANSKTTTYKHDARTRVCRTTDPLGHTHDSEYSSADNVTSTTDALAKSTSFGFTTTSDGISNLTSITGSGGASTAFSYGDADNPYQPDTKTNASGDKITYSYTAPGNLMSAADGTTGGTGASSSVTRNLDGTVATATDANNHTTTYTYTYTNGLLTKLVVAPPSGAALGTTTTNFDSLQRPSSVVDGKGQTHGFTYDAIDRVKTEAVGATTVSHTYDANGNQTQVSDPTGATTFTYDELNRTKTKAAPSRPTIAYTYDGVGNLKTLADAGGTVSYRYDAANRVDQLTEPGSKITTFGYDNADRRTSATLPNGVVITLGYDDDGRQTKVQAVKASTTIVDLKYCYAKVAITDTSACSPTQNNTTDTRYKLTDSRLGQTTNYAYDTQGRLTRAKTTVGGTDDFQYAYDKAGNRTKQTINAGTPTFYGYGPANELCWSKATATDPGSACTTPSGATTYSHDPNGNMTSSTAGFAATYNGFDQATSITGAGGSTLSPMTYGGSTQTERRRAGSTDFTNSALGLQVAAPTGGGTGTFYTRDPSGNLISQRTPTGTHYYVLDALGSVVALTDSTGAVVGRYRYEPYGKATFSGTVTSNFQFASGYYDSATKLVKFGARYYDPALGRWTQQDPIVGNLANPKTLNRYAYVGCDPVNATDPSGLYCSVAMTAALLALGAVAIGVLAFTAPAGIVVAGIFLSQSTLGALAVSFGAGAAVADILAVLYC